MAIRLVLTITRWILGVFLTPLSLAHSLLHFLLHFYLHFFSTLLLILFSSRFSTASNGNVRRIFLHCFLSDFVPLFEGSDAGEKELMIRLSCSLADRSLEDICDLFCRILYMEKKCFSLIRTIQSILFEQVENIRGDLNLKTRDLGIP
ncbi:hypothetical protein PMAYCL1PPCAC_20402, partial [Pristionchus mayeri]